MIQIFKMAVKLVKLGKRYYFKLNNQIPFIKIKQHKSDKSKIIVY